MGVIREAFSLFLLCFSIPSITFCAYPSLPKLAMFKLSYCCLPDDGNIMIIVII
ncbi:hypothetical protein HMPREF0454_04556 [Hafnia alvei ATCC 51873]|uniref:Uncharacterized protein n=1 Tax=Hafnia alvei ATCC 51873 TaxID=1002364 RepID=G9YD58_HAFAL|nr:hypothetical protein HMPREF0454_04556 [Hafnia alvei ATCC 51873]